jgi:hypothetical protein
MEGPKLKETGCLGMEAWRVCDSRRELKETGCLGMEAWRVCDSRRELKETRGDVFGLRWCLFERVEGNESLL